MGFLSVGQGPLYRRMNLPQKINESGPMSKEKRTVNEIIDYLRTLTPIQTPTTAVEHTARGVAHHVKPSTTTTSDTTAPRWG